MNSDMHPTTSGRPARDRSCSNRDLKGLIAMLLVSVLLVTGCGRRDDKTANEKSTARKSEALLERTFKAGGETVLTIENQEGFKQIKPIHNVVLTALPDALKIEATNNDPSVHLPKFSGGHDIVEVSVESPATTEMQLFYLLPGQRSFAQPQSEKRALKAGHNIAYFELPDPSWTGVLRLDPGMEPGVYLIKSIKVKAAPAGGIN